MGPGLGEIIGPNGNYASLSGYSKLVLLITMFLGRLEMLTILVLLMPSFWKTNFLDKFIILTANL